MDADHRRGPTYLFGVSQLIVTIALLVIIAVAVAVGMAQGNRQEELLTELRRQTELAARQDQALGCVLLVPAVDGFRDPAEGRRCYTDLGLRPPPVVVGP